MDRPFFVVGCPRSGTTLVRLLLHAHSRLAVAPESYFVSANLDLIERPVEPASALERIFADVHFRDFHLDRDEVRAEVGRRRPADFAAVLSAVYELYARRQGKVRWGDQTPAYALHVPTVLRLFPDARFVHVVRDARDVALSWRGLDEHRDKSTWRIANTWRWYLATAWAAAAGLPADRWHEVRYEELLARPEDVLRGVCAFLGEAFEPAMLDYHVQADRHIPERMAESHHRKLVNPILRGNAGKWRTELPLRDRLIIETAARPALRRAGYPTSPLSAGGELIELGRRWLGRRRHGAPPTTTYSPR